MDVSTAKLTNYRQAPRKVRLVADLMRGKTAERALLQLAFLPKRAAEPMAKLLRSAIANAGNGHTPQELYVSSIQVNSGIVFKRMMPRARGKGAPIKKKTSTVTIALAKRPVKKAKAKAEAAPAEAK